jgi:prefoldin subunit 5
MEQKLYQLPELEQLKQLLKDTKNIVFYKRVEFTGSKESVKYMKKKIKEFEILMNTGDSSQISGSI